MIQIPRDPPKFMLAPHSMTDVEYNLWGSGVAYAERLLKELDYKESSITHLMPSIIVQVYAQTLVLLLSFIFSL